MRGPRPSWFGRSRTMPLLAAHRTVPGSRSYRLSRDAAVGADTAIHHLESPVRTTPTQAQEGKRIGATVDVRHRKRSCQAQRHGHKRPRAGPWAGLTQPRQASSQHRLCRLHSEIRGEGRYGALISRASWACGTLESGRDLGASSGRRLVPRIFWSRNLRLR